MVDDPETNQKNKRGKDWNQRLNLTSAIKISATPLLLRQRFAGRDDAKDIAHNYVEIWMV